MNEPEPWEVCYERGGGGFLFTTVCVLGVVALVCIVGNIILFAVGALP